MRRQPVNISRRQGAPAVHARPTANQKALVNGAVLRVPRRAWLTAVARASTPPPPSAYAPAVRSAPQRSSARRTIRAGTTGQALIHPRPRTPTQLAPPPPAATWKAVTTAAWAAAATE